MAGYESMMSTWTANLIKKIERVANECFDEVVKMSVKDIEHDLKEAYMIAAQRWYDEYSPKYYRRRRGLFRLQTVESNAEAHTINYGFNPVYPARNGYNLIELVFIQGWHGGMEFLGKPGFQYGPQMSPLNRFNMAKDGIQTKWREKLRDMTQIMFKERFGI